MTELQERYWSEQNSDMRKHMVTEIAVLTRKVRGCYYTLLDVFEPCPILPMGQEPMLPNQDGVGITPISN